MIHFGTSDLQFALRAHHFANMHSAELIVVKEKVIQVHHQRSKQAPVEIRVKHIGQNLSL